jgi:hypothetical protein
VTCLVTSSATEPPRSSARSILGRPAQGEYWLRQTQPITQNRCYSRHRPFVLRRVRNQPTRRARRFAGGNSYQIDRCSLPFSDWAGRVPAVYHHLHAQPIYSVGARHPSVGAACRRSVSRYPARDTGDPAATPDAPPTPSAQRGVGFTGVHTRPIPRRGQNSMSANWRNTRAKASRLTLLINGLSLAPARSRRGNCLALPFENQLRGDLPLGVRSTEQRIPR